MKNINRLWHRRLGHLGMQNIGKLKSAAVGLSNLLTDKLEFCDICAKTKMTRLPFNGERTRAERPLFRVHSDVCGPIDPVANDGSRYFVSFIDDYSHMAVILTMKAKSEVFDCFKSYYLMVTAHFGTKISRLRCDQGGEYRSQALQDYCKNVGVILEYTVSYSPQLNGVAERYNRTISEKCRVMLADTRQPKFLWNFGVHTANFLANRSPSTTVNHKTPFEMWFGYKPDLSRLRVFGSRAFVHVPKEKQAGKLGDRAEEHILVGYTDAGYKPWCQRTRTVVVSRDVKFCEDETKPTVVFDDNVVEIHPAESVAEDSEQAWTTVESLEQTQVPVIENNETLVNDQDLHARSSTPLTTRTTRTRTINLPRHLDDYEVELHLALNAFETSQDVPEHYSDIFGRPDEAEWRRSVQDELNSLNFNKTWIEVPKTSDMKLIGSRWVFRVKYDADGNQKYKSRLVAKGFMQREGVDLVARLPTVRLLLAVGTQLGYEFRHLDVTTAFLNGYLDEKVYLAPPDGVEVKPDHVLLLKRSIYGLKQAPKQWNERFIILLSLLALFVQSQITAFTQEFTMVQLLIWFYMWMICYSVAVT